MTTTSDTTKPRICELDTCGKRFVGGRSDRRFCDDECRMAYHQRRRERAAELLEATEGQQVNRGSTDAR